MANKFAQGVYTPKNPQKFVGKKNPYYRSSWELAFMRMCDDHPYVLEWASENLKIPYQNPMTGKFTVYVPDFSIKYKDKKGSTKVEVIEIKPGAQTTMESAKSQSQKASVVLNAAKWKAAHEWCKRKGIHFRVLNESHMFANAGKRKRK
jgi:hypothetical protein|tara:strand:- start:1732 stop:2178 length:447 start_codon:yes stop_codon:yes gene_type:complete